MTDDDLSDIRDGWAWVIEFRSGSYFVNEDADRGGPIHLAKMWPTTRAIDDFVTRNEWILMNGGCPVPVCPKCRKRPFDRAVACRCEVLTLDDVKEALDAGGKVRRAAERTMKRPPRY